MTEGPTPRRRTRKAAASDQPPLPPGEQPPLPPTEQAAADADVAADADAPTKPIARRRRTAAKPAASAEPPSVPPPSETTIEVPEPVTPQVAAEAAVVAEILEHEEETHGHEQGEESNRLRTGMAILIALISITGALVTWRAEVAGSEAGKADREGTIVAVTAQGARQQAEAQARAEGRAAQRSYEAWSASQIYKAARDRSTTQGEYDANNLRFEQEDSVAIKLTDGYFVLDFVQHDPSGYPTDPSYDVNKRVDDVLAQGQTETNADRFFEEADTMEQTRGHLFAIDVALVLALALIAVGQVRRRRRTALMWAAPGTILFLVATALFIVVEV